jgi:hypothetical protein
MVNTSNLISGLDRPKVIPDMRKLTTFSNGGNMSLQTASWSIAALEDAVSYFTSKDPKDQILFTVIYDGCSDPFRVLYNYDGTTGNNLIVSVANALNLNPNICSLGTGWRELGIDWPIPRLEYCVSCDF